LILTAQKSTLQGIDRNTGERIIKGDLQRRRDRVNEIKKILDAGFLGPVKSGDSERHWIGPRTNRQGLTVYAGAMKRRSPRSSWERFNRAILSRAKENYQKTKGI
jgi:hypothetical protein